MDLEHPEQDHAEGDVGPSLVPLTPAPHPERSQQEPTSNQGAPAGDHSFSKGHPTRLRLHDILSLIFSGAVAFATIMYAVYSRDQLSVMRDTLKEMGRTARIQNRPLVRIREITPYKPVAGQAGRVLARLENNSRVRALFSLYTVPQVIDSIKGFSWRFDVTRVLIDHAIDPGGVDTVTIEVPILSASQIAALKTPENHNQFCIVGWIYSIEYSPGEVDNGDHSKVCWCLFADKKWRECDRWDWPKS